jgi:hypothetical protein
MRNSRVFSAVALLAFSAIGASGCATVHAHPSPPSARVTVVTFYDALSPYGDWIFVPGFGRVWRPWQHVVGFGFVPYASGGRWEYTSVGWVFESNWPWGGIAFHYGRWFYLDGHGWLWAPDTVWGPAWVDWRFGGGYVCWVPLPPPRLTVVVGVYRPVWYVVPTRYFPHGSHAQRFVREHDASPIVAQAAPVPPRGQPRGESWYVGPPPRAIASEANVEIRSRRFNHPPPLPAGALEVPGNARITQLPPPARPPRGDRAARIAPPPPVEVEPNRPRIDRPEPIVTPPPRAPERTRPNEPREPRVQPRPEIRPSERPAPVRRPAPRATPKERGDKG